MSTRTRQPAGTPVGGQFAATAHPEPDLNLEQLAEAEGMECATFDPDDPYGAWMRDGEEPAAVEVPADLTGLTGYELAELRTAVQGRIDRARAELDSCAQERHLVRDWGDADRAARLTQDEEKAERELDEAMVDLRRISEASVAGRMSVDDMTAEQRAQVDGTCQHAYQYGLAQVGGIALADTDEAEQFASYAAHQLTRFDFDESALVMPRLLQAFEAERAGELAAGTTDSPQEREWAKRMGRDGGVSSADVSQPGVEGRKQVAALARFARRLELGGFYLQTSVSDRGLTYRLTGGRPKPEPSSGAA